MILVDVPRLISEIVLHEDCVRPVLLHVGKTLEDEDGSRRDHRAHEDGKVVLIECHSGDFVSTEAVNLLESDVALATIEVYVLIVETIAILQYVTMKPEDSPIEVAHEVPGCDGQARVLLLL